MASFHTVTLSAGAGGSYSGYTPLYVDNGIEADVAYRYEASVADYVFVDKINKIPTHTNPAKTFAGFYGANGVLRVNTDRIIRTYQYISWPDVPRVTGDETWTAAWTLSCPCVNIEANGGSGGTARLYYDATAARWYQDYPFATEFSASSPIAIPTMVRKAFLGCYSTNGTTGEKYIEEDGTPTAAFLALEPSGETTVYAQWEDATDAVVLDHNGGSSTLGTIYLHNGAWYGERTHTTAITRVPVPTKTGHTFQGYFANGTKYISPSGEILPALAAAAASVTTVTATLTANVYTLTFDANGGTASFSAKSVTYGQAIGTLATATWANHSFKAWQVEGVTIKAQTVWLYETSKTAKAEWRSGFGDLTDYFGAEGAQLMLVESDSGEGRKVTNLWNGAWEQGSKLKNPVCTYKVKAAGTVSFTLGRCYDGFFLVGVKYTTGADQEPRVVLTGMANEGRDAIKTYAVSLAVDPDHVAQDPSRAVVGGGELLTCDTTFACDPAVVYEGSAPVASDICHGRVGVTATTGAYLLESAPTAGGSFIETSAPERGIDVDFATYSFAAERGL